MKTIAEFSKPEEAHLLRAHLEGSGIAAFVRDDHTVSADWALSNAIGGVKVDIADEDVDAALALLREFRSPADLKAVPKKKLGHSFGRYLRIAVGLTMLVLTVIAATIGFRGDVPPAMLVFSAAGIGIGVAAFCALYDL